MKALRISLITKQYQIVAALSILFASASIAGITIPPHAQPVRTAPSENLVQVRGYLEEDTRAGCKTSYGH